MKLIVGLGNPGKEYGNTRHNVGFSALDHILKVFQFEDFREEKKYNALLTFGSFGNEKIAFMKPLTFMNLSGQSIGPFLHFYKLLPQDCLVVYDDLDLPLGTLRLRKKGGSGTHNGMKSIVAVLGENFPRIRIGIESRGVTSPLQQDTTSFVLGLFNEEERRTVEETLQKAAEALKVILSDGLDKAMNLYNP